MDQDDPVTRLVLEAAAGRQTAWNALVERYAPLVLSVARGFRLAEKDVEDVSQTVWLRLVEHLGSLREPRALPMWIVTTTRHECLRIVTANKRTQACDPAAPGSPLEVPVEADHDGELLRSERHGALLAAFAELPDHQRRLLLVLAEDPPPSYREVSRRLDIPIGSIGPTRARALQRLRDSAALTALMTTQETGTGGGGWHESAAVGR